MTKEELIEKLREIRAAHVGASEEGHYEADALLVEYINDPDITEAYNAIPKWFA
jgi:hypothetical protein